MPSAAFLKEFKEAMARRGLNAVTAPTVVKELSTSKVLVTEWVEGTRLDRDASPDVPRLCGVAVNAYLVSSYNRPSFFLSLVFLKCVSGGWLGFGSNRWCVCFACEGG